MKRINTLVLLTALATPAMAAAPPIPPSAPVTSTSTLAAPKMTPPFLRGISLAGNNRYVGSTTWPTVDGMNYWLRKKMNFFRIMTMWNNLQTASGGLPGAYNTANLASLDSTINYLTSQGAWAVIDLHDSLRYKTTGTDGDSGTAIYSSAPLQAQFVSLWTMLARKYKSNPRVVFEITNEPHDLTQSSVFALYQLVINAIRSTGAQNMILIDGNNYSSASTWTTDGNDTSFLALTDPANNLVASPHQYLDRNGGTTTTCYVGEGTNDLPNAAQAARAGGYKLLLGEFGGGNSANCQTAIKEEADAVENGRDVWLGWGVFAAYAGQSAYGTPDTFFLGMDPDVYGPLATDDARLTNSLATFLTDTYPTPAVTAVAATSLSAQGGTGSAITAPDGVTAGRQLVIDTTNGAHQLYTPSISTVAGKKHSFIFDIRRTAGTGNLYVNIGDTVSYANYATGGVDLGTGAILAPSGNSAKFTYPTVQVRRLDTTTLRVTVNTTIEDTTGATAASASILVVPPGQQNPNGWTGDGVTTIQVWNAQWKVG